MVLCGLLVLLLRAALLPLLPVPEPGVHDEFANLLAADTFASGRLANPAHPMWQHLETFHVLQQPYYVSMYPPAPGLLLAAGQVLGHPWIGVFLSMGVLACALVWMLQAWLPPQWALLGGLLFTLRIGVFSQWMNSYWGGATAGIGGVLVFGALGRIRRRPQVRDAMLLGLGLIILANSRPYEGLVASLPVVAALLLWVRGDGVRRVFVPLAIVLVAGAAATSYYCWRTTDRPFRMPYQLDRETYSVAPIFLWQDMRPEPAYRHEVMRRFYVEFEPNFQNCLGQSTLTGWLEAAWGKSQPIAGFYVGYPLLLPFLMLPWVACDRRMRFWLAAVAVFLAGLAVERFTQPHYLAPMLGAYFVVLLQSLRHLRQVFIGRLPAGLWLARATVLLCAGSFLYHVANPPPAHPYPADPRRVQVLHRLESLPGRHLVIVRYTPLHDVHQEWVYNRADIDHAKIVFARAMDPEANRELAAYFNDRSIWLLQPDLADPGPVPFTE